LSGFGDKLEQLLARLGGNPLDVRTLRGIPVVVENKRLDISTDDVVQRLDESLALIERHQPWRLAHLRRDLKQIRVMRYPCRGAYFPEHRACMVELTFLARRDIGPATVASTIVHEGIHARVHAVGSGMWALGPRAQSPEQVAETRAREERICRRAELEFGQSLPPEIGAPVVERALASLALDDADVAPEIDWNEAMRRVSEADGK
jgi:hypothetical protein